MCRKVFASRLRVYTNNITTRSLKEYIDFLSTIHFDLSDPKSSHVAIVSRVFSSSRSSLLSQYRCPQRCLGHCRNSISAQTSDIKKKAATNTTAERTEDWKDRAVERSRASVSALCAYVYVCDRIGQKIVGARERRKDGREKGCARVLGGDRTRGPCSLRDAKERV